MRRKLIIPVVVMLAIAGFAFASHQQAERKIVIVRTVEYFGGKGELYIIKEDGIQQMELAKMNGTGIGENGKILNKLLSDLYGQGFELKSSNGGAGEGKQFLNYVLVK